MPLITRFNLQYSVPLKRCKREIFKNMPGIDKRNRFDQEVFSYRVNKDHKVTIYWYGKQVMILKGKQAEKFMQKIAPLDDKEAQLLMAKVTGNFKRGNEKHYEHE